MPFCRTFSSWCNVLFSSSVYVGYSSLFFSLRSVVWGLVSVHPEMCVCVCISRCISYNCSPFRRFRFQFMLTAHVIFASSSPFSAGSLGCYSFLSNIFLVKCILEDLGKSVILLLAKAGTRRGSHLGFAQNCWELSFNNTFPFNPPFPIFFLFFRLRCFGLKETKRFFYLSTT